MSKSINVLTLFLEWSPHHFTSSIQLNNLHTETTWLNSHVKCCTELHIVHAPIHRISPIVLTILTHVCVCVCKLWCYLWANQTIAIIQNRIGDWLVFAHYLVFVRLLWIYSKHIGFAFLSVCDRVSC